MLKELLNKIVYRSQEMNLLVNLPEELQLLDFMFVGKVDYEVQEETYEFGLVFMTHLDKTKTLLRQVRPQLNADSVFWLAYPSRTSKVRGNIKPKFLNDLAVEEGYEQFTNISLDENWDAMRLKLKNNK